VPRRWLLVSREAPVSSEEDGTNRWSVDHLFLDQDAVPTLIEVKQSKNTDIRRKVVGQMLDYAANAVVYWPVDAIEEMFESSCDAQNISSDVKLREFLGDSVDPAAFWQRVRTNLEAGRIRMLFVADEIPVELRRIVEFLNLQMRPAEVLAVEIKRYSGQGQKSLISRVIGKTEEATARKEPRTGIVWNEESFFNEMYSRRGSEESRIARKIFEWARDKLPIIWWGRGKYDGSFFPGLEHKGMTYYPIAIWTYGKVEMQFQWLKTKPPFDDEQKRKEILNELNKIPNVNIPENAITRRPNIPLSVFKDDAVLKQFLEVLDAIIWEIFAT